MSTSSASPGTGLEAGRRGGRRARLVVWCLAVVFVGLLAPKINSGQLWQGDELLTANRAREMLVRGDPSTVTLNFAPDFRKPPLQYWLCAATLWLLPSQPELAVRLPALLAGAACLVAVAWLARCSFTGEGSVLALGAAGALAVCGYFVHGARIGLLDTGAALCLTLTVAGCQRARADARWWWFVAGACVLGAWQKAPYGLGAWAVILLVRRFDGGRHPDAAPPGDRATLIGAWTVTVLAAAGWWLLQGVLHGFATVAESGAWQAHALTQARDLDDTRFRPVIYWFWMVRDWAVPGLCAPVAVCAALWPRARGGRRLPGGPTTEISWVCLVYAGALAFVPFRVERYLIVVTPLLALLAARGLLAAATRWPRALPAAGRRWVLPGALASALPVASFHYFSPTPVRTELLATARDFHDEFRPDETAVITDGGDTVFAISDFVGFYANLPRVWHRLSPEEIRTFPPPCRGICRANQWDVLRATCPDARQVAVHGEWIVWSRRRD